MIVSEHIPVSITTLETEAVPAPREGPSHLASQQPPAPTARFLSLRVSLPVLELHSHAIPQDARLWVWLLSLKMMSLRWIHAAACIGRSRFLSLQRAIPRGGDHTQFTHASAEKHVCGPQRGTVMNKPTLLYRSVCGHTFHFSLGKTQTWSFLATW